MNTPAPHLRVPVVLGLLALAGAPVSAAEPAAAPAAAPLKDSHGNTLRRAPTGHITNYDEDKVPPYTLPDPLVLQNGQPMRDTDT